MRVCGGWWRLAGTAIAAVLFTGAALPLRAQEPEFLELLVEFRIEHGPSGDVLALLDGTRVLLPLAPVLRLAEVQFTGGTGGQAFRGELHPSRVPLHIDPDSGLIRRGGIDLPADAGAIAWYDADLFVETAVLERLLGVRTRVSLGELYVIVEASDSLPVVRRLRRERRWARFGASAGDREPIGEVTPSARLLDGATFDWAVTSSTDRPIKASSVQLGLGAQIVGGSAVVQYEETRFDGTVDRRATGSWTRAWHDKPWLTQVRLGEVVGTGRMPLLVQGAAVTNSPFVRPARFADIGLDGAFGPGWSVEAYQGRRFVGYTRTDAQGRYVFEVPVQYGQNPLDLVAHGPNGEEVRLRRTVEIAPERFPARQFEWGASGGRCPFDQCAGLANADLRYGLTPQLTVRGGMDAFWRDTLPDLWHPYASVAYQPTRALAVLAEGVWDAQYGGEVQFAPSQDLRARIGHTRFVRGVVAPILGSSVFTDETRASLIVRPPLWDLRTFARVLAQRSTGPDATREFLRASVTTPIGSARAVAGVTYDRFESGPTFASSSTTFDAQYFHVYTGSIPWLRQTLFRAQGAVGVDSGLVGAGIGVNRMVTSWFQFDVGVTWQRQRGWGVELSLTAALEAVRAISQNRFDSTGAAGFQIAEGSVVWNRGAGRVEFSDGRSLGRAGVTGIVFNDRNGNGRVDPGERRLRGVVVQVGPLVSHTDEQGRFAVWDLVPFESVVVTIDALSVRDPLLLPTLERFSVRPDPNTFTTIPVPFVQAGEVEGTVLMGDNDRPVRNTVVELRNLESGDVYTTTTFSDGGFYLLGVRPGLYEATVPAAAEAGLTGATARFRIDAEGDGVMLDGIVIRLHSTTPGQN
jgi:hypothetical protein